MSKLLKKTQLKSNFGVFVLNFEDLWEQICITHSQRGKGWLSLNLFFCLLGICKYFKVHTLGTSAFWQWWAIPLFPSLVISLFITSRYNGDAARGFVQLFFRITSVCLWSMFWLHSLLHKSQYHKMDGSMHKLVCRLYQHLKIIQRGIQTGQQLGALNCKTRC